MYDQIFVKKKLQLSRQPCKTNVYRKLSNPSRTTGSSSISTIVVIIRSYADTTLVAPTESSTACRRSLPDFTGGPPEEPFIDRRILGGGRSREKKVDPFLSSPYVVRTFYPDSPWRQGFFLTRQRATEPHTRQAAHYGEKETDEKSAETT